MLAEPRSRIKRIHGADSATSEGRSWPPIADRGRTSVRSGTKKVGQELA